MSRYAVTVQREIIVYADDVEGAKARAQNYLNDNMPTATILSVAELPALDERGEIIDVSPAAAKKPQ